MNKLNDKQIEKLREAYGVATKIDGDYDWTGTFMGARDKIRDYALDRGMTQSEVFREIMAPSMNPILVGILGIQDEASSILSLGTYPAAMRAMGVYDDKKLTEGVTSGEFDVPLPESLKGGFVEEALTNVSPWRVAGGLAGGVGLAKGAQALMQKAFGMSTGLSTAAAEATAAGATVPTQVGGRLAQIATHPRAIEAAEMGFGVGALEVPATMIRELLAGNDVTADKVVEGMAVGIATGLAFDGFIALVPPALRATRQQIMNLRQAYRSQGARARAVELRPEIEWAMAKDMPQDAVPGADRPREWADHLIVEANKRGMALPVDVPEGTSASGRTTVGPERQLTDGTDIVETGEGTFRQAQPEGIEDTMRRRGIIKETADEIESMERELARDEPTFDAEPIRDDVSLQSLGKEAEFADDEGVIYRVERGSSRPNRPVLARSLEDGHLYELDPTQKVLTVRVTGNDPDPVIPIEKAGVRTMQIVTQRPKEVPIALIGTPGEPPRGGGGSGGGGGSAPQRAPEAPQEGGIAPDPVVPDVPKANEGPSTGRPRTVDQTIHDLEGQMKSGLGPDRLDQIEAAVQAIRGPVRLRKAKKRVDAMWVENQDDPVYSMFRARLETEVAKIEADKAASKAQDQFADDVVEPMGKPPTEESAAAELERQKAASKEARDEAVAADEAINAPAPDRTGLDMVEGAIRDHRKKWDEARERRGEAYARGDTEAHEAALAEVDELREKGKVLYNERKALLAEHPLSTDEVLGRLDQAHESPDEARSWFSDFGRRAHAIIVEAGLVPNDIKVQGKWTLHHGTGDRLSMSGTEFFTEKGGVNRRAFDNVIKQVTDADPEKGAEFKSLVDAYVDFHSGPWEKMKKGEVAPRPKNRDERAADDAALRDEGKKPEKKVEDEAVVEEEEPAIYHENGSPIVVGDRIEYGGERLNVEFIDPEKRLISGTNRGKPVSIVVDAKHHPRKLGKASKAKPKAEQQHDAATLHGFIMASGGINKKAITVSNVSVGLKGEVSSQRAWLHDIDMNVDANTGPNKLFRKGDEGASLDQIAEGLNEIEGAGIVDHNPNSAPGMMGPGQTDPEILALIQAIRKRTGNIDGPLTGDDLGSLVGDKEFMHTKFSDSVEDAVDAHYRQEAEEMGIDPDNPDALDDDFNVAKFLEDVGDSEDAGGDMDVQNMINFRKGAIEALKKGETLQGTKLTPEMRGKLVNEIAEVDHEIKQIQRARGQASAAAGNRAGQAAPAARTSSEGLPIFEQGKAIDEAASTQQGLFGDSGERIKDLHDDIAKMKARLKELEDTSDDPFSDEATALRQAIADAETEIRGLGGESPSIGGGAGSEGDVGALRKGNAHIHARERGIFGGDVDAARLLREQITGKTSPMDMTGEEQQLYIAHLRHMERIRTEAVARDQDLDINALHEAGARDPDDLLGDLGSREEMGLPDEFGQEMSPFAAVMQTPTSTSNLSGTFLGSLLVRGGKIPKHLKKFFTDKSGVVRDSFVGGAEMMRRMFKELGNRTTELHGIAEEAQMTVAEGRKVMQALDGQIEKEALGDPRLIKVYDASRQILNDLADRLELSHDQRISEYAPHIFKGRLGELIAQELAGETGMNVAAAAVNFDWRGRPTTVARVPQSKFFQHLMKRKGAEGYEMDWATVMQAYTRGATRKIYIDQFLKEARILIGQTPKRGKGSTVREEMASYAYYVAGGTSNHKKRMAHFLSDSEAFNGGVDRLMALLAPGNSAKNLGLMYDSPEQMLDWYRKVVEMSHLPEGPETAGERLTRARAAAAIAVDDLRAQLSNPNAGPVILSQLQRIMAWHKLGGNMAHFVTNSTQFLVNSVPELGTQAAARGAWRFLNYTFGGQKDMHIEVGKVRTSAKDLLEEIRHDVPSHSEFLTPSRFGRKFAATEDIVFAPSQWSEYWNRGATVLGKYEDALRKMGDLPQTDPQEAHQQALVQALQAEQKTQFMFNRSGTPKFLRSPLARTMFMFQSYVLHQINFSWDIFRDAAVNPSKENLTRMATHLGAYAALIGPGMMAGYETSDRYAHPLVDKAEQMVGAERRGSEPPLLNFFGGPWAGSIWQTAQWILGNQDTGQFMQRGVAPAAVARMIPKQGERPGDYVLRNITGLRPTKAPTKKRSRTGSRSGSRAGSR